MYMMLTLIEELTVKTCGLFSIWHVIALILCLLLVVFAVYMTRNFTKENVINSCKIVAVFVALLEVSKIIYKFAINETFLDAWFPLAYCSLLIYALFLSGYAKGWLQKVGHAFLSGPAFIAGMAFLIFPTTSLAELPVIHFLSFHSMFYHSIMVYFGIMFYKTQILEYEFSNAKYYLIFLLFTSIIAIFMSYAFECNMMFYGNPYNFPFQFVIDLYNISNVLYTIFIFCAYSTMYYLIVLVDMLVKKLRKEVL